LSTRAASSMSVRTLPAGNGRTGCNGASTTIGVGATTGCAVVGTDCCGTTVGAGCCFETGAGIVTEGLGAVRCCAATGVAFVIGLTVRGRVAAPPGVCACASAGTSASKKNPTLLVFIIYGNLLVLERYVGGAASIRFARNAAGCQQESDEGRMMNDELKTACLSFIIH